MEYLYCAVQRVKHFLPLTPHHTPPPPIMFLFANLNQI